MTGFKDMFSEDTAAVRVAVKDKADALSAAVDLLARNRRVPDAKKLLEEISKREALASTGIGYGVAVPHVLCDAVTSLMFAALTLQEGVDFNSDDRQKVDILFIIAGPKGETASHLQLLSKLARLLHDQEFRGSLRAAPDPGTLAALIYEQE
jgi:fructose-specific phosphotransferase system IIA component